MRGLSNETDLSMNRYPGVEQITPLATGCVPACILRLMGERHPAVEAEESRAQESQAAFGEEERFMISGVLTLAQRSVRTIMTPRLEISWIDCESDVTEIRSQLLENPHSLYPVCRGTPDSVVGVVRAKELAMALDSGDGLKACAAKHPPIVVPYTIDIIKLLGVLRKAKGSLVLVMDEYGAVEGLVTPLDILEAIAGEFPDADETPEIVRDGAGWLVKGSTDLHLLEQSLGGISLANADDDYATIAGLLLAQHEEMPTVGGSFQFGEFRFEMTAISDRRIELIRVSRILSESTNA